LTLNRFVWPDRGEQPRHIAEIAQRLGCFLVAGSGISNKMRRAREKCALVSALKISGLPGSSRPTARHGASHDANDYRQSPRHGTLSNVTQRRGGRREPD